MASSVDVILDVDPGVDDAMAILMALGAPELNVLALTVVSGNVPVHTGTDNALRILAFAGRDDIGVYAGADRPIEGPTVHATEVHGASGLGKATLPPASKGARDGAAAYIAESLRNRPQEITVIAVGPLTNLALVERESPGTLDLAKQIIVMGGAVAEPGNVTAVAEFNFYADPLAAQTVVAATEKLVLVPLDVTHQVGMGEADIEAVSEETPSQVTDFFRRATEVVVNLGEQTSGYKGIYLHDPAAVAFAICPSLFQDKEMWVSVETEGRLTAGQLVADLREGVLGGQRQGDRRRVVSGVQADDVLALFRKCALGVPQ